MRALPAKRDTKKEGSHRRYDNSSEKLELESETELLILMFCNIFACLVFSSSARYKIHRKEKKDTNRVECCLKINPNILLFLEMNQILEFGYICCQTMRNNEKSIIVLLFFFGNFNARKHKQIN